MKNARPHSGADLGNVAQPIDRGEALKPALRPANSQRRNCDDGSAGARRRPVIVIRTEENEVVDEALSAVALDDSLFQRAGALVHVVRDPGPVRGLTRVENTPRVARVPLANLRERLARAAAWVRKDREGNHLAAHPPEWAVRAVEARGEWTAIRPIHCVVEEPVLRPDGTVLQEPGYDARTGLVYEPGSGATFTIAELPTAADAIAARDQLFEVVRDFPFATPCHRASWLAALLTLFARYAFDGQAPLFLYDANVRAAGKSLLADVTGIVATGRTMARMTYDQRDEEMSKRITALALAGDRLVLLDNVVGTLGCASLDAALTGPTWKSRILGRSENTADLPLTITWFATGNNVMLAADTARRTLHIRLDARHENPEDRSDFVHRDLLAHVRSSRSRLAGAALTILRAFCLAGRPDCQLQPWGSFEAWSRLVRAAVVWVGCPDPLATRQALREQSDTEAIALRALIAGVRAMDRSGRGISARKVLEQLAGDDGSLHGMREALEDLVHVRSPGQLPTSRQLGKALTKFKGRVVTAEEGGAFAIECRVYQGTQLWIAQQVDPLAGGIGGSSGIPSATPTEATKNISPVESPELPPNHPNPPNETERGEL